MWQAMSMPSGVRTICVRQGSAFQRVVPVAVAAAGKDCNEGEDEEDDDEDDDEDECVEEAGDSSEYSCEKGHARQRSSAALQGSMRSPVMLGRKRVRHAQRTTVTQAADQAKDRELRTGDMP